MAARRAKGRPPCPVCGKAVAARSGSVPFCSPRCKMVDLGRWFTGGYVIAGEDAIRLDPEELDAFLREAEADKARGGGTSGTDEGDEPDDHA